MNIFNLLNLQTFVVDGPLIKKRCQDVLDEKYRRRHYQYVTVEEDLRSCPDWPPMSQSGTSLAELMRSETTGTFTSTTPSSENPSDFTDDTKCLIPTEGETKSTDEINPRIFDLDAIGPNVDALLPNEIRVHVHSESPPVPHHKPNI